MSKREIPEINAGSMADIAFLLLIFFLVTTTMDKDQAYIRKIPKKVLVEIPPVEVQERNILAIKANNQGQLMVRDEIFSDPNRISDIILEFYRTSERENKPDKNFPLYYDLTMSEIEAFMEKANSTGEEFERQGKPADFVKYYFDQAEEWRVKKNALELLGARTLRQIDGQANIRIEVQAGTEYGLFAKIQTEIEEGIYELRDEAAKRLFGESYGVIKKRFLQDDNNLDKQRISLLEILYPARIIEVTPKK